MYKPSRCHDEVGTVHGDPVLRTLASWTAGAAVVGVLALLLSGSQA